MANGVELLIRQPRGETLTCLVKLRIYWSVCGSEGGGVILSSERETTQTKVKVPK